MLLPPSPSTTLALLVKKGPGGICVLALMLNALLQLILMLLIWKVLLERIGVVMRPMHSCNGCMVLHGRQLLNWLRTNVSKRKQQEGTLIISLLFLCFVVMHGFC